MMMQSVLLKKWLTLFKAARMASSETLSFANPRAAQEPIKESREGKREIKLSIQNHPVVLA